MRRNTAASTHSPTILPPLLQDGLLPGDEVDHLHLEDVPGKAQRCFTAFDCGIKVGKGKLLLTLYQQKAVTLPHPHHQVFLLSSGKQLVDLPSLHSRPVTSLLFFRPLRLLITAAKDGASTYPFMSSKPSLLSSLITNRRGWDAYICTLNWAVIWEHGYVYGAEGNPHQLSHSQGVGLLLAVVLHVCWSLWCCHQPGALSLWPHHPQRVS